MKKRRKLIGVIGAEVNNIEQRQILKGIISQTHKYGADVAVISNLYNTNNRELLTENRIYELITSPDFDALILLSESFVDPELKQMPIAAALREKHIPMIMVGTPFSPNLPPMPVINTSDADDLEEITDHMIDAHHCKRIDMLTGYAQLECSQARIAGYRRSLEKHGLPFEERRVFYGNYWYNGGEEHAMRYISGELSMPDAVVCGNDYMAFGMLDTFGKHNILIPQNLIVIGYEYIPERHMHFPILTTYQRNREALGETAVDMLYRKLNGLPETEFSPPKGTLQPGYSCPCGMNGVHMLEELENARTARTYDLWNQRADFDQNLTECTSLDEFVHVMGEYQFLVRFVQDITLCLFEDWYSRKPESVSDVLRCQSVMPWLNTGVYYTKWNVLSTIIERQESPAVYYFSPIFFQTKLFGYMVLRSDKPDTYDEVYRCWLKSASNALEFLRMKNDVRYLTQCRNIASESDSMTGMPNKLGLLSAFETMRAGYPENAVFPAVYLRVCENSEEQFSKEYYRFRIKALLTVSEVIRSFCGKRGLCGRVGEKSFLVIWQPDSCNAEVLADALYSLLVSDHRYLEHFNTESLCCFGGMLSVLEPDVFNLDSFSQTVQEWQKSVSLRKLLTYYPGLLAIRDQIYLHPAEEHPIEKYAKQCTVSVNYLNAKYKECFGVSFHQDCINSRIHYAKSLLITTEMSIASVAEYCGCNDTKYFFRRFAAAVGMTPKQYRMYFGIH